MWLQEPEVQRGFVDREVEGLIPQRGDESMCMGVILSKAAVNASVESWLASRQRVDGRSSICVQSTWCGLEGWVLSSLSPLLLRWERICGGPRHAAGEALAVCALAHPPWRASSEARTLLTISQGGVHRGAPSPCAATPPRLALSGALVLNAGYEHSQQPAALWTACTQPCCMEPRDGPPGMKQL